MPSGLQGMRPHQGAKDFVNCMTGQLFDYMGSYDSYVLPTITSGGDYELILFWEIVSRRTG